MTKSLNDLTQIILVQQIAFISQAQDMFKSSGRAKDARNITELATGLTTLTEAIGTLNDVGIVSIDMESIKVLLNKIELENNYHQDNNNIEYQEETDDDYE